MGRSGESAGKRRVTALRNERKAAKTERRHQRQQTDATTDVDDTEIMTRFLQLNQLRSEGDITEAEYQRERADIYRALGLEDPLAPAGLPDSPLADQPPD